MRARVRNLAPPRWRGRGWVYRVRQFLINGKNHGPSGQIWIQPARKTAGQYEFRGLSGQSVANCIFGVSLTDAGEQNPQVRTRADEILERARLFFYRKGE